MLPLPGPPISHFTPEDRDNGKVSKKCSDYFSDAGCIYQKEQIKMLPTSLESATIRMMRPDSIAREPEIFGNAFVDHYGGTREHEVRLWNQAVTNWEGAFYPLLSLFL